MIKRVQNGKTKAKISIRTKITFFVCAAAFIVVSAGVALGYFLGFGLMRDTIGENQVKIAQNLASSISDILEGGIKNVLICTTNPVHGDAILESTSKYTGKDPLVIKEYLLDMDNKWATAKPDGPLVTEYLRNKSAERLKKYVLTDKTMAGMFITDKFGGLVAASGKTSDFYQADEEWWQEAYNAGEGGNYISDIEYDESTGTIAMTVAVPVKDEKGEVTGVCKTIFDVDVLFAPAGNFKTGKTGHAVLVDNEGFIVLHRGIKPLSVKMCSDKEFESLVNAPEGWGVMKESHIHEQKELFTALAVVQHPLLLENGIIWRIFVNEDVREVFQHFNKLFTQWSVNSGILVLLLMPVGFIFGGIFVKPIKKLQEATECIEKGELDYPIDVKTGDEIEQLAGSFKNMASEIRSREDQLKELNETLEDKVDERMRDLKRSQEAALHLLEDLLVSKEELEEKTRRLDKLLKKSEKSRKMMVRMLDNNNTIRNKLQKSLDELKKMQKIIVQSEKLSSLGKLLSEMAHEVNNPLQAISGRAQLALMGDIKDQELKEDLRIIESQCYRAGDIVRRLLDFSRPSKGEVRKKDLKDILEDIIKLVEYQYSLAGIKISRDYAPDDLIVRVDVNQIEEVFFNIIKNAAEAMEQGGSITVAALKENGKAQISFKDTGSGMPEEVLQNIFDPFYTTKKEGTGLGLSVCYGLVKDHGGEIRYESKPGEGTTAVVIFPMEG